MATGLNEYYDFLQQGLQRNRPFVPQPFYDKEADALFFYARDVPSYAKRLNPFLTLFLAAEDDTLVGVKVKSIRRMVQQLGNLKRNLQISVKDRKIKLGILLALALVSPPDTPELEMFTQRLSQYEDIEFDSCELVVTSG